MGPGNFLSKFLGDLSGGSGLYGSGDKSSSSVVSGNNQGNLDVLLELEKSLTFSEYTEAFPSSLKEFLSSKTVFGDSNLPAEDCLAISSDSTSSNLTALWIEVARVYLQEGLLQDAEAAVNQAFMGNEIYSPIFGAFGLIEEHRSNEAEAEVFYRKGLAVDEFDETCLLGLARVLLKNNSSKSFESERLARIAIQRDPSNAEAWSLLAQTCSRAGRTQEALKYFEIALKKESQKALRSTRSIPLI